MKKQHGWVPTETVKSKYDKDFLRFLEEEIDRKLESDNIEEKIMGKGNSTTPIESRNGELWNQLRQGITVCLEIDKEFIKELSDDELETIAKELQGGLIQIQTYEPFRRDLDLLCAISEEYVRRQQVKHHEEEERKKNLDISQTAVSEFMRHMWEETGIAIPNKYFQSFFKDK